jgi:hypothetical protein
MKTRAKYKEIEVDIPDELFLKIAKRAHERNITFNKMANILIKEHIDELRRNKKDSKPKHTKKNLDKR